MQPYFAPEQNCNHTSESAFFGLYAYVCCVLSAVCVSHKNKNKIYAMLSSFPHRIDLHVGQLRSVLIYSRQPYSRTHSANRVPYRNGSMYLVYRGAPHKFCPNKKKPREKIYVFLNDNYPI